MAGEAFLVASAIVSFLAGIVALAMPCCFSVLLPSYFASAFKRGTAIFRMTLVFALGVAAVLLPIALGITAISIYIGLNHSLLFVVGGFFMLFLGAVSLLGIQLVPMMSPRLDLQNTGIPTIFALGAFSGVASSCCAPVLAGMIVLTALTTSLLGATLVGSAYVLGMVFPLLAASLLVDRTASIQRILQGRMLTTAIGTMHSSRLLAGAIFTSMGAVTIVLGITNNMLPAPGSEVFNIYESMIQDAVQSLIEAPLVQGIAIGVLLLSIGIYLKGRLGSEKSPK